MNPKTVILIVDDDPGVASVLHKRLSVAGYEPYMARGKRSADKSPGGRAGSYCAGYHAAGGRFFGDVVLKKVAET